MSDGPMSSATAPSSPASASRSPTGGRRPSPAWCGAPPPDPAHIGTAAGFNECRFALAAGEAFAVRTKSRCDAELHRQLIGLEGRRVAVVDADGQPDRFWVGKSTGWLPCYLRVHSRRSRGGPAVDSRPFQRVTVVR